MLIPNPIHSVSKTPSLPFKKKSDNNLEYFHKSDYADVKESSSKHIKSKREIRRFRLNDLKTRIAHLEEIIEKRSSSDLDFMEKNHQSYLKTVEQLKAASALTKAAKDARVASTAQLKAAADARVASAAQLEAAKAASVASTAQLEAAKIKSKESDAWMMKILEQLNKK